MYIKFAQRRVENSKKIGKFEGSKKDKKKMVSFIFLTKIN